VVFTLFFRHYRKGFVCWFLEQEYFIVGAVVDLGSSSYVLWPLKMYTEHCHVQNCLASFQITFAIG
jgi:hypothetical protein